MQNPLALIHDNPLIHLLYCKRFISVLQLADLVSVKNRVISSVEWTCVGLRSNTLFHFSDDNHTIHLNNQFVEASENKIGGACSKHGGGKLRRNQKEIYSLGDSQRSSWVDNVTMDLKQDGLARTWFIWLKTVNWQTLVNVVKSSRFE
jgi:hypothetical protein